MQFLLEIDIEKLERAPNVICNVALFLIISLGIILHLFSRADFFLPYVQC